MRKTLPNAVGRVFSIDQLLWKLSLVLHEFLGCSQLVAHVTEQLLALLQEVEVYERYLQQVVVLHLRDAVDVAFTDNREFVLTFVCKCKSVAVMFETAC